MRGRKGYLQGYNAQAVVNREQIIIASGLTHQLMAMIGQALHDGRDGDGGRGPSRRGSDGCWVLVGGG